MRTRKEVEEQVDERLGASGGYSVGISTHDLVKIQIELLLDIRDLLSTSQE